MILHLVVQATLTDVVDQNTADEAHFSARDEAVLVVRAVDGTIPVMVGPKNLGNWYRASSEWNRDEHRIGESAPMIRPGLSPARIAGLVIILLSATIASARDQEVERSFGTISGIVVDQNGQRVPGVEVTADDTGMRPHVGPVPRCESDARGRFALVSVRPGDVVIHTAKQQDGYVDTQRGAVFDAPERLTRVTVLDGQHVSDVVVRIGPPVGVVSGVVLTGEGQPLPARIQVIREDMPEALLSIGANVHGEFVLALPPVPYTLQVEAPGYEPWSSESDVDQVPAHHIVVMRGDRMTLRIALQPDHER